MTSLVLSGSDNTIWGRAIQYEGLPIKEVIQYANEGDPLARGYVCAQAGLALSSGKPLPRALRLYAAMVLLEEAENSRGRGRPTEWGRNAAIVFLLDMLKTFDIPPTRSDGTDPDEQRGSRIVAEWLNEVGIEIGEPGVAKVWEKYHEQILALKARHKN